MWHKTLSIDSFRPGHKLALDLGGRSIGVFHTLDGIFAIDNICPHAGAELHRGEIRDGQVLCPFHRWRFNLASGKCEVSSRFDLRIYAHKIEDGYLWIQAPANIFSSSREDEPNKIPTDSQ